jgi:polyhydroxybutyrate depolymerase
MTRPSVFPTIFLGFVMSLVFLPATQAQWVREKVRSLLKSRLEKKAQEVAVASDRFLFPHEGQMRSYYRYVPKSWDGKTPLPLVFLFHGGGGGARGALHSYELEKKAEEAGFLLIAPNGTGEVDDVLLTWNVSFGFGYAQKNKINDVGFIKALLEYLETEFPIDPNRIFATGLSNGGIFCHFLAAQPWNRLAAIAPVVGTAGGRDVGETTWHTPPSPRQPVSACLINGLLDDHIPVGGGKQRKSLGDPKEMLSASATIDFWVAANTCHPQGQSRVDTSLKASVHHFSGGKGNTEVTAYILHNMGHAWPGSTKVPRAGADKPSPQFPGNDIIWEFFRTHPRSPAPPAHRY